MDAKFGQQNELNVVSIGDSQTTPRLAVTAAQTYPLLLAGQRNYGNVTNAGISGNTTTQMLARYSADCLAHRAGCMSAMGGPNDWTTNISGGVWVGGGISVATTKSNLKTMAEQAIAQRAFFTLLTPVPVFSAVYLANAGPYISAMLDIGTELGIPVVDVYAAFIALPEGTRNSYLVDDQHPNAAGHAYIASLCTPPAFSQA